jgi:hypothetical protein
MPLSPLIRISGRIDEWGELGISCLLTPKISLETFREYRKGIRSRMPRSALSGQPLGWPQ